MTPQAATELLNVVMLDDYVGRRKALDLWSQRWVATMELVDQWDPNFLEEYSDLFIDALSLEKLTQKMVDALTEDEVHATEFKRMENGDRVMRMFVLLQKPREPKEGK